MGEFTHVGVGDGQVQGKLDIGPASSASGSLDTGQWRFDPSQRPGTLQRVVHSTYHL